MFLIVTAVVHAALIVALITGGRPLRVVLVAYAAYHVALAWGVTHPRSRLFGRNISRIPARSRSIALTFDDGPNPDVTPRILDVLRANDVRATFFLVGRWVRLHPDIVRRIVAEGHAVGNHSDAHSYGFWALLPRRLRRDVCRAQAAIHEACGVTCRWFRAPVGLKSFFLHPVLRREGLELVGWEARWLSRGPVGRSDVSRWVKANVRPGSIVALHDGHDRKAEGRPEIVDLLPRLVATLADEGYRLVSLDEALGGISAD